MRGEKGKLKGQNTMIDKEKQEERDIK